MFKVERDTCGMCVNVSEVTAGCVPALQLESSELKVLVLVQHTAPYATTLFLCECCCIKLIIKSNTVVHKGGVFSSLRGREVNCPPVLQGHPGTLCLQYMHLRYESQGFFIKASICFMVFKANGSRIPLAPPAGQTVSLLQPL